MNRPAALSLVALLGSLSLGAQNTAGSATVEGLATVSAVQPPADLDCPVSMHAQHGSGGGLQFARDGRSPAPGGNVQNAIAQRIHLSLGSAREPAMVKGARVTVHGTSAKWRAIPTVLETDGSSGLQRTLDITFHPDATVSVEDNEGTATDMVLSGFTSVQSITLDSLTYADGSIWTPPAGRSCRVIPDPLMLVSSSR